MFLKRFLDPQTGPQTLPTLLFLGLLLSDFASAKAFSFQYRSSLLHIHSHILCWLWLFSVYYIDPTTMLAVSAAIGLHCKDVHLWVFFWTRKRVPKRYQRRCCWCLCSWGCYQIFKVLRLCRFSIDHYETFHTYQRQYSFV